MRIILIYHTYFLVWNSPSCVSFCLFCSVYGCNFNLCSFELSKASYRNINLESNQQITIKEYQKKHKLANFKPKYKYDISKEFSQPVQQDYDMFKLISYKNLLHKRQKDNFFVGRKLWKFTKPIKKLRLIKIFCTLLDETYIDYILKKNCKTRGGIFRRA